MIKMSQWFKHTQRLTTPGPGQHQEWVLSAWLVVSASLLMLLLGASCISWTRSPDLLTLQELHSNFNKLLMLYSQSVVRLWCKMSEITIELKRNHWIVRSTTRCWPRHWWSWSLPIPPSPPSWSLQSTTPSRTVRPPRSWSDQWKVSWKAFINQEIRNKVNY